MPELPEVENVARGLKHLEGQILRRLEVFDRKVWFEGEIAPEAFEGKKLAAVSRRGKYLVLSFSGGHHLVQHLRMTGKMLEENSSSIPYLVREAIGRGGKGLQVRSRFVFERGNILFYDTRRFGTLTSIGDLETYFRRKKIAPDLILDPENSRRSFLEGMAKSSRAVKAVLLDQSVAAGAGNIYADEALFATKIHPATPAKKVREPESVWHSMREIMKRSLDQGGTSIIDYRGADGEPGRYGASLLVYGRSKAPCVSCATPIRTMTIAGRTTHFCPNCQKRSVSGGRGPSKAARQKDKRSRKA